MMDLDQLFTVTDYKTTTIRIPCGSLDSNESENEQEYLTKELSIDLFNSQAASTDYDLTGQILWPVSVLLSHYLASTAGQAQTQGRQVVELGAGTGLPGLVAAHFARQVAVTDGNQVVVELVQKNVTALEANMDKKNIVCPVSASQCVWGDYAHLQALLETMVNEVDVVVAADVVQWPAVLEPLLHTVKALLWNSAADQPVFLVGIVNRAASTYNLFFQLATDLGFVCYMVESTEYLRDGEIPDQCREFGGRTTEIYRVTLEDRSIPPVLLQEQNVGDDTKDWTVGKSFEHTAFLPC